MKATDYQLRRSFYLLGNLMFLGGLLYWGRPVLIPVTVAILVTFLLAPLVGRMERTGLPRVISSAIAIVGVAVLVLGIGHLFMMQVRSLTREIPAYETQISEKINLLRQAATTSWVGGAVEFVNKLVDKSSDDTLEDANEPKIPPTVAARMEFSLLPIIQSVAGMAFEILFNIVLIFVLAFLMLLRREDLRHRPLLLMGEENLAEATQTMDDASKRISRFLLAQLVLNISFGVVIGVGLYWIGISNAFLWGAMAAVLRYIPYLGGWLAAIFPLLASLVLPGWTPFLLTALYFVVLEGLQANLIEPLVYGQSIGVSGVGQLIAALFWGSLWGPVGLIVSTPLTACVCVFSRHFPGLRFISTLIGDNEVMGRPVEGKPNSLLNLAK